MDYTDFILFVSAQLLKMDDKTYSQAVQDVSPELKGAEFDQPQKADVFSVGAIDHNKKLKGYWRWLEELRADGFHEATVEVLDGRGELPPHIAAAFVNGVSILLTVFSKNKARTYLPEIKYARSTWVTGSELEAILDDQFTEENMKEELWKEILVKEVNRYGSYMQATTIQEAREFMTQNYERFFCPADEILRTAQYFCAKQNVEFRIPHNLAEKLEKRPSMGGLLGNPYSPYPIQELEASEIVELVNAQNIDEIWIKILEEIWWIVENHPKLKELFNAMMSSKEVEQSFLKLTPEDLMDLPLGNITSALGSTYIIPENLKSKFIFPELPPIPDDELWVAKANPDNWRMLAFDFLQESDASKNSRSESQNLSHLVQDFVTQLKEAESFAKRVKSPFAEAFAVSHWILSTVELALDNKEEILRSAQEAGFSDTALRQIETHSILQFSRPLRLSELQVRAFMALGLANVFGGMGSWNDQSFDGVDNTEYKKVSNYLFAGLQKLKLALLSNQ